MKPVRILFVASAATGVILIVLEAPLWCFYAAVVIAGLLFVAFGRGQRGRGPHDRLTSLPHPRRPDHGRTKGRGGDYEVEEAQRTSAPAPAAVSVPAAASAPAAAQPAARARRARAR